MTDDVAQIDVGEAQRSRGIGARGIEVVDPVTPSCSSTEPDCGPPVITTASLAPVTMTETVCGRWSRRR